MNSYFLEICCIHHNSTYDKLQALLPIYIFLLCYCEPGGVFRTLYLFFCRLRGTEHQNTQLQPNRKQQWSYIKQRSHNLDSILYFSQQICLQLLVCAKSLRVRLFATLWTVAHQAPLSMGVSRQEYWNGLPCPPPGDLPNPEIESVSPKSPALAGGFFVKCQSYRY